MSIRQIKKNPVFYLQHLEEQVKLKKSQTTSKKPESVEREQNFKLFFSGANDNRIQQKHRKNEQSNSPSIRRLDQRKRWGTPTTPNILKESILVSSSFNDSTDNDSVEDLVMRFKSLPKGLKQVFLERIKGL